MSDDPADRGADAGPTTLTLHSSWRGIIASTLGASLVLLVGALAVAANGAQLLPIAILVGGVILVAGVLADYPVASTFTVDGVERRAMVRRHRIAWTDMRQLTRARPGFIASARRLQLGGLVAVVGKRRYLLVDQVESADEFAALERLVDGSAGEEALETVLEPNEKVPPTWMYRAKRWAPDDAHRR